jgi:hypothetical protein
LASKQEGVKHVHVAILSIASILLSIAFFVQTYQYSYSKTKDTGFDQYGYNYSAKIFNGKADGVDRMLDGKVWGDTTYANDRLNMKWSDAWDQARFSHQPWNCSAWEDNEWNGKVPGGSGEVWHYKIVWVGPELQKSSCWRQGGDPIWGQFEVIFSQGTTANKHFWESHAYPAGYGGF